MKYICTETKDGDQEVFSFPNSIDHDAMFEALHRVRNKCRGNWERISRKAISAGFVDASNNCYGESLTLDLKSRPIDTIILKSQMIRI